MCNKFPQSSGIYRIEDNIEQLLLRISLRRINTFLELPKFDSKKYLNGTATTSAATQKDNVAAADKDNDELYILQLRWQQKVLSADEMKRFKEADNCSTATELSYNEWLLAGGGAFVGQPQPKSAQSKIKSKKRGRRKEKQQQAVAKEAKQMIFSYVHADEHQPQLETPPHEVQQKDMKSPLSAPQTMYVYADLDPQKLLITLRWHAQEKLLHIFPDFTRIKERPYYIELYQDYRQLYAYGFENISPRTKVNNFTQNPAQLVQLPLTHWQTAQQRAAEFAPPPKHMERIVLLFEINAGRDFEYEPLHVRYRVKLPPSAILEEGLLEGSTHSSIAYRHRSDDNNFAVATHNFGHNWQLTLLWQQDANDDINAALVHIYYEVISIDNWQRERLEGLAHSVHSLQPLDVVADKVKTRTKPKPRYSDCQTQELFCVRPVEDFLSNLRRYFIGGRQLFDVERFFTSTKTKTSTSSRNKLERAAAEEEHDESENVVESPAKILHTSVHCTRLDCAMQTTGILTVNCQRLRQRNCELLQPCLSRASGMTLDDIMLAYREARRRLEAVVLQ